MNLASTGGFPNWDGTYATPQREMTAEEVHELSSIEKRRLPREMKDRFAIPWCAKKFPIRAFGPRIILQMVEREELLTESGIIIPSVVDDRDRCVGIVAACGEGEYLYDGRFVTMEFDYDITIYDILYVEPNSGLKFRIDTETYRVVTPNDVIGLLRRDLGTSTRERLEALLHRSLERHLTRGAEVASDAGAPLGPEIPAVSPTRTEPGEIGEKVRERRGKATKTQIVVPAGAAGEG